MEKVVPGSFIGQPETAQSHPGPQWRSLKEHIDLWAYLGKLYLVVGVGEPSPLWAALKRYS